MRFLAQALVIGIFFSTIVGLSDSYADDPMKFKVVNDVSSRARTVYIQRASPNAQLPLPSGMQRYIKFMSERHFKAWMEDRFWPTSARNVDLNKLNLTSIERIGPSLRFHFTTKEKPHFSYTYDFKDMDQFNDLWVDPRLGLSHLSLPQNISSYSYEFANRVNFTENIIVRQFEAWLDRHLPARFLSLHRAYKLNRIRIDSWGVVHLEYMGGDSIFEERNTNIVGYKIGSIATYNKMVGAEFPMFRIPQEMEHTFRGTQNFLDYITKWETGCAAYLALRKKLWGMA
jgi:hypothetical protein